MPSLNLNILSLWHNEPTFFHSKWPGVLSLVWVTEEQNIDSIRFFLLLNLVNRFWFMTTLFKRENGAVSAAYGINKHYSTYSFSFCSFYTSNSSASSTKDVQTSRQNCFPVPQLLEISLRRCDFEFWLTSFHFLSFTSHFIHSVNTSLHSWLHSSLYCQILILIIISHYIITTSSWRNIIQI